MMAYQEWIKFGRDPVYPKDFYALSRKEARAFFDRFMKAMPERMSQLTTFMRVRRPRSKWNPDYTDESFCMLMEVLTESVEKVSRTDAEIKEIQSGRSEIMNVIDEPIWRWKVSDWTISIAFDAAIYFGNDLVSKESRMIWRLEERQNGDHHQPIVRAPSPTRKPPFLSCAPLDMFRLYVFRVANNDPHQYTLIDNRDYWINTDIAGYKRNNPE